jgi:hypothetical protein
MVQLAVMHPTDRNYELIAHSASECTRLSEGEVMRIRGYTAAYEACLSQHESSVLLIAQANGLTQRTDCFVVGLLLGPHRSLLQGNGIWFA